MNASKLVGSRGRVARWTGKGLFGAALVAGLVAGGCSSGRADGAAQASNQAVVENVAWMVACNASPAPNCPPGSFAVTCRDGTTEVDTADQVRNDDVCNPPSAPDPFFDPASCPPDVPVTEATLATRLGAQSLLNIAQGPLHARSCTGAGCTAWRPFTKLFTFDVATSAFDVPFDPLTTAAIATDGATPASYTVPLSIANVKTVSCAFSSAGGETNVTCPAFQLGNGGGSTSTVAVQLQGVLRSSCLQLTGSYTASTTEYQFAVLANVSPTL